MPGRVIRVRFGVDEKANRQRGELLHRVEDRARIRRIVTAVDQHHAFLGHDDAAIGIEIIADVDVDAVFDLFEYWAAGPGPRDPAYAKQHGKTSGDERVYASASYAPPWAENRRVTLLRKAARVSIGYSPYLPCSGRCR